MKNLNYLSQNRGSLAALQSSAVGYDCRSTVVRPSFDRRSTLLKLVSVLVLILTVGVGNAWGDVFTHEFTSTEDAGSKTWSSVSWTVSRSGGKTDTYSSSQGAKYGTNNNTCNSVGFSTSDLSGTISSVTIEASRGSSLNGTLAVSVGSNAYTLSSGNTALTTSNAANVFTGNKTGALNISWTKSSGKGAFYIKKIVVKYGYKITFNCNGASSGCPSNISDTTKLPNPLPSAPTKSGYTFGGWYTNEGCTTAASAGASITANTTLYAKWTADASCTANPTVGNASLNGSISLTSFPLNVSSVGGGTNCTLAEYGFVWKAGSNPSASDNKTKIGESSSATSFTGSITGSFNTGVTYYIKGYAINNGPNTMLSATALTITPRSVTFNSNGGSAVDTKYVNSGTKVTAPSDPTKTGYNFGEWQLNSSEFDFANTNVTSNIILVATWTAKTTTVSFNQTSGTGGQTGTLTATYGSAMPSAPVTCPTRTGYDFGGYYDGSGGTGTQYYTSTGASARTWNKEDATYTLHAKWTIKNYTITWKVNGETWSDKGGSTNANYNTAWSSLTLPTAPDPENDGCGQKFVGWTTTENYSNATTAPTDLLNADNKSGKTAVLITDNVEFHAVFADYDEP